MRWARQGSREHSTTAHIKASKIGGLIGHEVWPVLASVHFACLSSRLREKAGILEKASCGQLNKSTKLLPPPPKRKGEKATQPIRKHRVRTPSHSSLSRQHLIILWSFLGATFTQNPKPKRIGPIPFPDCDWQAREEVF